MAKKPCLKKIFAKDQDSILVVNILGQMRSFYMSFLSLNNHFGVPCLAPANIRHFLHFQSTLLVTAALNSRSLLAVNSSTTLGRALSMKLRTSKSADLYSFRSFANKTNNRYTVIPWTERPVAMVVLTNMEIEK